MSIKIFILLLGIGYHGQNQSLLAVRGELIIPGRPKKAFVQLRDINIGVLMSMSSPGTDTMCTDVLDIQDFYTFPEVVAYSLNLVNHYHLLPRNITMGFVLLDDCYDDRVTAMQTMAFVRKASCSVDPGRPGVTSGDPAYDVVAVIGSETSSQSVAAANLLGPAHIPQISAISTSDGLTSKRQYPYFMRVVPPNRFQFQAILQMIKTYGWTYISVVYDDGSYGLDGFYQLRDLLVMNKICLATVRQVPRSDFDDAWTQSVAEDLIDQGEKARVVVMITGHRNAQALIEATGRVSTNIKLIWIATVAWAHFASQWTDLAHLLQDSLLVQFQPAEVPEFESYFRQLTPYTTEDPWFWDHWQSLFNCSLDTCDMNCSPDSCDKSLSMKTVALPKDTSSVIFRGYIADIAIMIANATSRVIRKYPDCDSLENNKIVKCVTGPRLLRELKETDQVGFSGWLELDDNGDRLGLLDIKQLRLAPTGNLEGETIDIYNTKTAEMRHISDALWTLDMPRSNSNHPLSQCSFPCEDQSARSPQNVSCCWTCNRCELNERIANNGTICEACPTLTWPDTHSHYSTCVFLKQDEVTYNTLTGMAQITVSALCLLVCFGVVLFFQRHRQYPVATICYQGVPYLTLLAIAAGYVVVILMSMIPNTTTCILIFFFFCTSFTLMYSSILVHQLVNVQTHRTVAPLQMSRPRHQLFVTFFCLSVQVVICALSIAWHPVWHLSVQASSTVPVVEHTCELPINGMSAFMAYNMLLVTICAVLSLIGYGQTADPNDDFSEMRFVSMTIYTTLILGVCFVPAYLVAARQIFKMIILTLAILFSHTMGLICLFLAKIYRLVYVYDISYKSKDPSYGSPTLVEVPYSRPGSLSASDTLSHWSRPPTPSSTPMSDNAVDCFAENLEEEVDGGRTVNPKPSS